MNKKRNVLKLLVLLVLVLLFSSTEIMAQGLKASGKKIVDDKGNEVILRGMGLGGWMLQEPYMLDMSGFAGTQWQIKEKIETLIGTINTEAFYDKWLANHCTRRDIDSLASWGFNSVRLPMHYNLYTLPVEDEPVDGENTWLDRGFAMTDSLISWCKANHMYVILDLHAAPGGQGKDAAISDANPAKPTLWESTANRLKTIALWRKLAERYANEPWVGAYDLINEPNWSFTSGGNQNGCSENQNAPLRQMYIDLTNAIRQVDTKHMLIIEGNCWGNNYNGIFPLWDNNMALSFHKYWSNNDQGSISGIVGLRNTYNVPIWLGESGENSNGWFTDAIQLVENNGIGWAWWPLKKIGSVVNPLTIVKTNDYQVLLNYWNNGGTAPSVSFAVNALMQIAENLKI
ncbi:MAG TPA: cellulase family glycosylhydrolase, partial [Bacteroidales bacterium]|nr:cellulase family glycosylhydrolase [Bacteroidales bacterium]